MMEKKSNDAHARRSYQISGDFMLFQGFALIISGVAAFCLVGNLAIILVVRTRSHPDQ